MMAVDLWTVLDVLLAALVVGLGGACVSSKDLRRAVVLFIAFGLLLALVWARLRAPDLALAEAAIGAGLSGALLLSALRDVPTHIQTPQTSWFVGLVSGLTLLLALVVGWAWWQALTASDGIRLAQAVAEQLPRSGVSNPVTAVLLNFRAYDTLLELAVLLAAVLGILALGAARPPSLAPGAVLQSLVNWLVPVLMVMAGYLLWIGAKAPGGAFQAGAVLAAAGVLLRLGGHASAGLPGDVGQRWLLAAGITVFTLVGTALTLSGRAFLHYPVEWAGTLILLIEIAATLSIAVLLVLAYMAGRPDGSSGTSRQGER